MDHSNIHFYLVDTNTNTNFELVVKFVSGSVLNGYIVK